MRLHRLALASTALFLLPVAQAAQAQDRNWSGPYIGVYGGFTQENGQEDERLRFDRNLDGAYGDTVSTAAGADAFSPGYCGGRANGNSQPQGCQDDAGGSFGGIRAGYDMQFGPIVAGVVADYGMGNQSDAATGFSTTPANYTFVRKLESVAALRARLGYAWGPALIYATGGVARGSLENRFFSSNTANTFTPSVDDDEADGHQLGGGVEYRLAPNLSVTGEYLYTSLDAGDYVIRVAQGTAPATNPFVLAPNTTGTDMIRSNSRFGMHAVNIGMSYRF